MKLSALVFVLCVFAAVIGLAISALQSAYAYYAFSAFCGVIWIVQEIEYRLR